VLPKKVRVAGYEVTPISVGQHTRDVMAKSVHWAAELITGIATKTSKAVTLMDREVLKRKFKRYHEIPKCHSVH